MIVAVSAMIGIIWSRIGLNCSANCLITGASAVKISVIAGARAWTRPEISSAITGIMGAIAVTIDANAVASGPMAGVSAMIASIRAWPRMPTIWVNGPISGVIAPASAPSKFPITGNRGANPTAKSLISFPRIGRSGVSASANALPSTPRPGAMILKVSPRLVNIGPSDGITSSAMVSRPEMSPPSASPIPVSIGPNDAKMLSSWPLAADAENASPMDSPMLAMDRPIASMCGPAVVVRSRSPWVNPPVPDCIPLSRFSVFAKIAFMPSTPRADPRNSRAPFATPLSWVATPPRPCCNAGRMVPETRVRVSPRPANRLSCTCIRTFFHSSPKSWAASTNSRAFGLSFASA